MAITKIGAPLSGIRGSIGGITFSENKASTYAKLWTPPSNPSTTRQSIQRAFLAKMGRLWSALTDPQRADWDTFAALPAQELTNSLGEAYYISGFGWFCKTNVRLERSNSSLNTTKPTQARPAAPTITEVRICPSGSESDQCTCGVATASTTRPGFPAAWAFDDNVNTPWSTSIGNPTGWIQYDFCDPVNIKRFRLHPNLALYTRCPGDWRFRVWSAGAWQTIMTITNEVWALPGWHDYACPNPYTEELYVLDISANQGDPNYINIGEIEMYIADVGFSCAIWPEDEFENGPAWQGVMFTAMSNLEGRNVQYPGYYETIAHNNPGRHFRAFQDDLEAAFGTISLDRKWFTRIHRQTQQGVRGPPTSTNVMTLEPI